MGLFDNVSAGLNRSVDAVNRGTRTAGIRRQINDISAQRQKLAAQLGASLYEATRTNPEFLAGRESLYEAIAALDAQRAQLEQTIREIENETVAATVLRCHVCGSTVNANDLFCTGCGTPVSKIREANGIAYKPVGGVTVGGAGRTSSGRVCPQCGKPVDDDDVFCIHCGTRIGQASQGQAKQEPAPAQPLQQDAAPVQAPQYDSAPAQAPQQEAAPVQPPIIGSVAAPVSAAVATVAQGQVNEVPFEAEASVEFDSVSAIAPNENEFAVDEASEKAVLPAEEPIDVEEPAVEEALGEDESVVENNATDVIGHPEVSADAGEMADDAAPVEAEPEDSADDAAQNVELDEPLVEENFTQEFMPVLSPDDTGDVVEASAIEAASPDDENSAEEETVYTCPVCGAQLESGFIFCGVCGTKVDTTALQATHVLEAVAPSIDEAKTQIMESVAPSVNEAKTQVMESVAPPIDEAKTQVLSGVAPLFSEQAPSSTPPAPATAKQCPNCGFAVEDDDVFCMRCGTKLV